MSKKYSNPPIIEAVCDFRLTPDSKWDLTIPGFIYEKVGKDFPKREQRVFQEVEFVQSPQGFQQQIRSTERVLFLTDDGKMFIQVGPNLLAINCLKPYLTWNGFKPKIEKAFNTLVGVLEVKGLQRISLRYINRIEIPGGLVKLEDHFDFYPHLGPSLPQDMGNFIVGCLLPFRDGRDLCKVQLTPAVAEKPNHIGFLLDLDYFLSQPGGVIPNDALDWVEDAHRQVEAIFEACITDRLRKIFKEES